MGYPCIDLAGQADVTVLRAWQRGRPGRVTCERLSMGTCGAGWWVRRDGRSGARVWLVPHERAACTTIERWIRSGGWTEVAACITRR